MNKHIITSKELINKLIDFIEQDKFETIPLKINGYVPTHKENYKEQPFVYPYLVFFESNYYIIEIIYSDYFMDDEGNFVNYDVTPSYEVWMISEYDAKSLFLDSSYEDDKELRIKQWNNWKELITSR